MDYRTLQYIVDVVRVCGSARIEPQELERCFHQSERNTPVGNAIMNLCNLPDEKQTFERWLRAQNLEAIYIFTTCEYLIKSKSHS